MLYVLVGCVESAHDGSDQALGRRLQQRKTRIRQNRRGRESFCFTFASQRGKFSNVTRAPQTTLVFLFRVIICNAKLHDT